MTSKKCFPSKKAKRKDGYIERESERNQRKLWIYTHGWDNPSDMDIAQLAKAMGIKLE